MSKILGKIFGNAGGSILEKLSGVADKFIQTKEEKAAFQKEMTEIFIKAEADMADKADTRLKALFKLSDIMDLEDKNAPKIQSATAIQFKGFTDDMIDATERPKEIE